MSKEKTKTISLKLSKGLLGDIDSFVGHLGYKSRSDFIRKAIILFLHESKIKRLEETKGAKIK